MDAQCFRPVALDATGATGAQTIAEPQIALRSPVPAAGRLSMTAKLIGRRRRLFARAARSVERSKALAR
jgi:hypothetical protein